MVVLNLVRQLFVLVLSGSCSVVRLCARWSEVRRRYTFLLSQSQDMMLKRKYDV